MIVLQKEKKYLLILSSHLPVVLLYIFLYYFNNNEFVYRFSFPDSEKYIALSQAFLGDIDFSSICYPFRIRVIIPFIVALLSLIFQYTDWVILYFWLNAVLMIAINWFLYLIFKMYAKEEYAIFGVWVHNLSYPVIFYFLAPLTGDFVQIVVDILKLPMGGKKHKFTLKS